MDLTPALRFAVATRPRLPRLSTTTLAVLALAGAAALWGTSFVAAKAVLTEIPPVTLACLRFTIAALILVPLSCRGLARPVLNRDAVLLGLTGISLFFLCQYAGLRLASAADATVFLGGGLPALTALLGLVVLDERLDRWQLGGLICSLLGIAVVALGSGGAGSSPWGAGLLFLAAACGAIAFIAGRRVFSGANLIPVLAGSTIYGVLFLLPPAAIELRTSGMAMAPPSGQTMLIVLYLGAGCSALAFALWAYGLRHLSATQNAVVSNLELPVGLLAALLLGDALGWGHLAGGPLIVAGALLAAVSPPREERAARRSGRGAGSSIEVGPFVT